MGQARVTKNFSAMKLFKKKDKPTLARGELDRSEQDAGTATATTMYMSMLLLLSSNKTSQFSMQYEKKQRLGA
jgi:hypothetical protein